MKSESIHRVAADLGVQAHYDTKIKTWAIGDKVFTVAEIGKMSPDALRKKLRGGENKKKAKKETKPRAAFDPEAKITLLVKENPKRSGSNAHAVYALYRDGMTVSDFIAAGGSYSDLKWDMKHKSVKIEEPQATTSA